MFLGYFSVFLVTSNWVYYSIFDHLFFKYITKSNVIILVSEVFYNFIQYDIYIYIKNNNYIKYGPSYVIITFK